MKRITILIPTLNEEKTIEGVVSKFKQQKFDDVLVIDGNSTDSTRLRARSAGADVIIQRGKGKGQAVQQALSIIQSDIVVMIDGDGTYDPFEVFDLLAPIVADTADHVIGNRFAYNGDFTSLHRLGNFLLSSAFHLRYNTNIQDFLSGYRALTSKVIESIVLAESGFEVETELTIQTIKKNLRFCEVPIHYYHRLTQPKLRSFKDGSRILLAILK